MINFADSSAPYAAARSGPRRGWSVRSTSPGCLDRSNSSWATLEWLAEFPSCYVADVPLCSRVLEPGQCRAPSCARWRREPLPDSRQGTVVHCDRSAVKGGDGKGPEAFGDQINAQRKLPYCDRDCEQPCRRRILPDETEQHGDVASHQKGRSGESE